MTSTSQSTAASRVFQAISAIPLGKVATYKQIAIQAGLKNPRQVGQILRSHLESSHYPCHRVVRSDGSIVDGTAFGERFGQILRLREEGVVCLGGRIDLKQFKHLFIETKNDQ